MAVDGLPVQMAARVLAVSESGYYDWKMRPPSARTVRHAGLTESIRAVHAASRGIYGARRVHAELTLGQGIHVSHGTVELLMKTAGIQGLSGVANGGESRQTVLPPTLSAASSAVVCPIVRGYRYHRTPNPSRARSLRGRARHLLPTSRRLVHRRLPDSSTGHQRAEHGHRTPRSARRHRHTFRSRRAIRPWVFTQRAKASGLVPSMGSIGDCYDNSMIEAFWSSYKSNCSTAGTGAPASSSLTPDYLEIWHNRQRRHSQLGMLTPLQFEDQNKIIVA
jgi:putative transposase